MASFVDGNNHVVIIRQALNFEKSSTIITLFVRNVGILNSPNYIISIDYINYVYKYIIY